MSVLTVKTEKIEASHSPILINLSYLALVPVATSTESEDREVRSFTQSHTNLSYLALVPVASTLLKVKIEKSEASHSPILTSYLALL